MKKSSIACIVIAIAMVVMGTTIHIKKNSLYDQQAAKRWSQDKEMEQISLIYPVTYTERTDDFFFENMTHQIQDALDKSAFANESGIPDDTGITFPYSVCIEGKLTIVNEDKKAETNVLGVDKDFFTFHPVNLLYGSYISGDDLMKDGIVIDDDIAWKLFGSSDVVGKMVTISGVPHYIKGVMHKDEGRIADAAGLDSNLAFVSMDSLTLGTKHGSYVYELILPNPVENFALNLVKDTIGNDLQDIELVDNTTRYNAKKCVDRVWDIGLRSMSQKDIIYPYFENEARAWEDILAVCYGVMYLLGISLAVIVIIKLWVLKKERDKRRRKHEKGKNRYLASVRTAVSRWMRKRQKEQPVIEE